MKEFVNQADHDGFTPLLRACQRYADWKVSVGPSNQKRMVWKYFVKPVEGSLIEWNVGNDAVLATPFLHCYAQHYLSVDLIFLVSFWMCCRLIAF